MNVKIIPAGRDGMLAMHPGEILKELYLDGTDLDAEKLAELMSVHITEVEAILNCSLDISEEIAKRLSVALGTTAELWLNLQKSYIERLN